MPNRYKPNKAGFTALANSAEVQAHMRFVGEYWAGRLQQLAPYSDRDEVHYRDNVTVDVDSSDLPRLPKRQSAFIAAQVRYATALELGNSRMNNPPRPMTKLLDEIQSADPNRDRRKHGGG